MNSEKNGVLIFAQNNETIDYMKIAKLNKKLIQKHLNVPVCIISENNIPKNTRTFKYLGENETVTWHNYSRPTAYELSPFENTLLLDADYLIQTDNLKFVWGIKKEFLCANSVYDLTGKDIFKNDKFLGNSFPLRWATCIFFRKSKIAENIFSLMKEIRENYKYYSCLFNFKYSTYRNDYALTIALQLLSGYNDKDYCFHFPLFSLGTEEQILDYKNGYFVYQYNKNGIKYINRHNSDIHLMNKKDIISFYEKIENTI